VRGAGTTRVPHLEDALDFRPLPSADTLSAPAPAPAASPARAGRREAAMAALRETATHVELDRVATKNRERRLDLERRAAALRRQQQVVQERLGSAPAVTPVLVAHRDPRRGSRLAAALATALGHDPAAVEVADNGADAVAVAVLAQPAVVAVDAPLPMMSAADVVADIRRYVPDAVVVACAGRADAVELRQAGATVTYPPGAAAEQVVGEVLQAMSSQVPSPRP
jgi:CheY-like chemotaxis protein